MDNFMFQKLMVSKEKEEKQEKEENEVLESFEEAVNAVDKSVAENVTEVSVGNDEGYTARKNN